jgi:hypothetical protein
MNHCHRHDQRPLKRECHDQRRWKLSAISAPSFTRSYQFKREIEERGEVIVTAAELMEFYRFIVGSIRPLTKEEEEELHKVQVPPEYLEDVYLLSEKEIGDIIHLILKDYPFPLISGDKDDESGPG